MFRRSAVLLCLALSLACTHVKPQATAPVSCPPGTCPWPDKAWLTVERDQEIIKWTEAPAFPDRVFAIRYSADGVTKVVDIQRSHMTSIYEGFKELLADGDQKLTKRGFKRALRQGQLTCHFGATTWPQDEYAGVSGTDCVNNLLFSLQPPSDTEHLLPQLGIILVPNDSDTMVAKAEKTSPNLPETTASPDPYAGFVPSLVKKPRSPRTVAWEDIRPILELSADQYGAACNLNVPAKVMEQDSSLVDAVVTALVAFQRSPQGEPIFRHYRELDTINALWDDPCLPGMLEEFLENEKVYLQMTSDMAAATAACEQLQQGG